jgi:Mg2+-importing ATPase
MADEQAFWRVPIDALFKRTDSSPAGLTGAEAAARLTRFGPNTFADHVRIRFALRIAKRFAEPLVAILLIAAAVAALTGDLPSFVIIVTIVALSITLDVVQESRAEAAAEALRRSVAVHADVRRDGATVSLPVDRIVPGDLIALRAGDLVPADGVIVESRNLHVNEALMTGEPYPADKRAGACEAAEPADAFNALFAGTSVVGGDAVMLAVETGGRTRFGAIAAAVNASEQPSAFERGLHRLGMLILRLTIFLVLFVLLVNLAFGRPMLEAFLFAVALAVGLTPELLPMVTTVTLSRGALRMAKQRVIVKRLAAIHDFGAMDVLCTDKTGTLTEARIALVGHPGCDGRDSEQVVRLAALNSAFGSGVRSPLDQAIVDHCGADFAGVRKIDELPFDFARRLSAVLIEEGGRRRLIVKGAPEAVLAQSAGVDPRGDGSVVALDAATRARLDAYQNEQAAQGYRLLAVAFKDCAPDRTSIDDADERDLVIVGFCVFLDPPKVSATAAVQRLADLGVRVKVISGDHEAVVRHLSTALRISNGEVLNGAALAAMSDLALAARVEEVDLFARVSPDQKTRIIRALQARGHTVGFIGDGVNDAPAIHRAEVGVSVEGATDVARAAADMILLAPDLGVLADGVEEGRRTFANILKYVRMGTSSNFGNMLSMALASLILPFLPLLPIQILLNNLLYDGSEIGIPFDGVDREDLTRPRKWDMGEILRFTLIMGALSSAFDFATFAALLKVFNAGPEVFHTAWFVESTATQILVIFIIRTRGAVWKSFADPVLTLSSLAALGAALAIVASPWRALFGFTPLGAALVGTIVVIVAAYLVAAEIAKRFAVRRH